MLHIILHILLNNYSEILIEEKHQQQETMRRENRRVQAMSWGTLFVIMLRLIFQYFSKICYNDEHVTRTRDCMYIKYSIL